MAISRDKKQALVGEMTELLGSSKMTVFANYQGLSVADLQELRARARETGVVIKVAKNRLVRVAIENTKSLKDVDTADLTGQLIYAASDSDEVAPAQVLDKFAKDHTASNSLVLFLVKQLCCQSMKLKRLPASPARSSSSQK